MRIASGLSGLALAVTAGSALADTVVLQQSGANAPFIDVFHAPLPGAGTYRVDVSTSIPLTIDLGAGYTYHWDTFVAPPPHPHADFIEGNTADVFTSSGAEDSSFSWTFIVPDLALTFFNAPAFYEFFGVPEGTAVYREDKYEDPFVSIFLAKDFGNGPAFDYAFTVTRLDGASGPIPEPELWAEMILGFAIAGAALRALRQRRLAA